MKNTIWLVVLCLFVVQLRAQRKPKIKGNRNVTEVREDLPPYNAIILQDDLEMVLQKSDREGFVMEADDNLVDVLKFKVADSTLVISSYYKVTAKKRLNITVNFVTINHLEMQAGEITMKDVISTEWLEVKTTENAKLQLNATADIIHVLMEGKSSGDFNVATDSLNLTLKDRVAAKVYATGASQNVYMYNNASAQMEGTTGYLMAKLYGESGLKAEKLEAQKVQLTSEDSPSANVKALDVFELSSKGSSKTSLYGNPTITIMDFLDTSQLHKEYN